MLPLTWTLRPWLTSEAKGAKVTRVACSSFWQVSSLFLSFFFLFLPSPLSFLLYLFLFLFFFLFFFPLPPFSPSFLPFFPFFFLSFKIFKHGKRHITGTSLVVQWLTWVQGMWVRSVVGELRFHMLCSAAKRLKKKTHNIKLPSSLF